MIRNLTGSEQCGFCHDDAQVFVGLNAIGTDQMAPCPKCERGSRLEHSTSATVRGRDGKTVDVPRKPPWRDGYWQGRPTGDVEPMPDPNPPALPLAENKRRLAELRARASVKDMP